MLGFYSHFKTGDIYEVIAVGQSANNADGIEPITNVVYRSVKKRRVYTRDIKEFTVILASGEPRFQLLNSLASQQQLLAATLRLCRFEYLQMARENPLFGSHGGCKTFVYMVGDKISFARSLRIVNTEVANKLIAWLNTWTLEPSNGSERYKFASDEYKMVVLELKSGVVPQGEFHGG